MTSDIDLDILRESLPPVSAEEVLPRVLDAMDRAQATAAFRDTQMSLVRHIVNSVGGPEHTAATLPGQWVQVEHTVRSALGMQVAVPGDPRTHLEHVEDWLTRLDPRVIEQLWINHQGFHKSNAQAVREGLLELVRKESEKADG